MRGQDKEGTQLVCREYPIQGIQPCGGAGCNAYINPAERENGEFAASLGNTVISFLLFSFKVGGRL